MTKFIIREPRELTEEDHRRFEAWFRGDDEINLSFWFPKLEATGVRVPKTTIIEAQCALWELWDNKEPEGFAEFIGELRIAAEKIGFPVFLRCGYTSDKHDYDRACFVRNADELASHVTQIVDFCGMVDISVGCWAVREFLTLRTAFIAFGGLPVNRERRYFIEGGRVLCHHPYWPEHAIEGNTEQENWKPLLAELNFESPEEIKYLTEQSEIVSSAFDGAWSLDWAQTASGEWYAIDMAWAGRSFHWESCPRMAALEQENAVQG